MIQVFEGNGQTNRMDRVQMTLYDYVTGLFYQRMDENIQAELQAIFGPEAHFEIDPRPKFVIKDGNRTVIATLQDGEVRVAG
jgi:hypothetical protein